MGVVLVLDLTKICASVRVRNFFSMINKDDDVTIKL